MIEAPWVPAESFLEKAAAYPAGERPFACLDVRSEGEFRDGGLPDFVNLPILNDRERHEVGLAYKTQGQAEAIRLGHGLVSGAIRESRIEGWRGAIAASSSKQGFVACWRGGLRSRIACEWIEEAGFEAHPIQGGYKALRKSLMAPFSSDRLPEGAPRPLVVTGLTGAGKTGLLLKCAAKGLPIIDLEGLARHRGSSFGLRVGDTQPSQAVFENALAWEYLRLRSARRSTFWVEDESRCIGKVMLPAAFRGEMDWARVVVLDTPIEKRASHIHEEYVAAPLRDGIEPSRLRDALCLSVVAIRKRLGGAMTDACLREIDGAFREGDFSEPRHAGSIRNLLVHYYDQAYRYSIDRSPREILFQGDADSCLSWMLDPGKIQRFD